MSHNLSGTGHDQGKAIRPPNARASVTAVSDTQLMQRQLDDARRKVDVDVYTITIRELLAMVDRDELHRAPDYQRKFQWNEEAESRLIESILLGLPVPNIFVATNEDGSWEVVDGLQRVSTLIHFAAADTREFAKIGRTGPLRLTGLRELTAFNGLVFEKLPPSVQLNFTKRGIGVTALSDKSDRATRYETFERLNRGALALSPQEIRSCVLEGRFNGLLRELAEWRPFHDLVKLQRADESNATREELVLKFFAYLNNREAFRGAVDEFLTGYMESASVEFDYSHGRELFERVVGELTTIGPVPFLRSRTSVTPKIELEAVMVAAAQVLSTHGRLAPQSAGWLDDPELVEASTGATNTKKKLRDRIARAETLLTPN